MKTFIIQEKFTGYADIHIEAKTEDEAIALYNRGHYKDSQYFLDDFFYNYQFDSITEWTIWERSVPVNKVSHSSPIWIFTLL